ncbi:hypothetical protein OS493_012240 [Desmophyllum pertusum]|uniref:Uncharacterized protein n=1 Tax=Desmophyllum pertusum TaxID=174260 RepID=A0A9W9ZQ65_9CNID|nr:hypothetical protein OS493_012240 [Desmophyllum pertusum]
MNRLGDFLSKMADEETSPTDNVAGTSGSSPNQGNPANISNNKGLASSLDNINTNMDKMASLLVKLCEKHDKGERPLGSKRKAKSNVPDSLSLKRTFASQENEGVMIAARMTISVSTLVTSWTTQTTLKCSPSVRRPPAKKSGKPRQRTPSSFKISPTVLM